MKQYFSEEKGGARGGDARQLGEITDFGVPYFQTSKYLLWCHEHGSYIFQGMCVCVCGGRGGGGGQCSHIRLKGLPLLVVKNADLKAINNEIWVAFVCLKS